MRAESSDDDSSSGEQDELLPLCQVGRASSSRPPRQNQSHRCPRSSQNRTTRAWLLRVLCGQWSSLAHAAEMRDPRLLRYLLRATPGQQVTPGCLKQALQLLADGDDGESDARVQECRELLTLSLAHWQPRSHSLYPGPPHQHPGVQRVVCVVLLTHQRCRFRPLTLGCVPLVLVVSILAFAIQR